MKNIVLTGFMGTGKSTVGILLAKKLGRKFIDTDAVIVDREGRSISDIFAHNGEEYFRRVECEVIESLSKLSNCVISTGGGTVLRAKNIENLKKNGIVINLSASVDTIYKRTSESGKRPLLDKKTPSQIEKMLHERADAYANNNFCIVVDDQTPMTISDKIIEIYKKFI